MVTYTPEAKVPFPASLAQGKSNEERVTVCEPWKLNTTVSLMSATVVGGS